MRRTIRLREETLRLLKELKVRAGARSYDEVIQRLLGEVHSRKPRSGAHAGLTPFAHEETSHE